MIEKPKEHDAILYKYASCMQEINHRMEIIQGFVSGKLNTGYLQTNTDLMCLQMRKILELIALSNMVSNKNEYAKRHSNFARHYHAKHIIRDIEKLNPNFYPIPVRQIGDVSPGVQGIEHILDGFLTKEELIEIYDECSELMHAENPFSTPKDFKTLYSKFPNWISRISVLLKVHIVQLLDINWQIWAIMKVKEDGRAHAYLFQRLPEK